MAEEDAEALQQPHLTAHEADADQQEIGCTPCRKPPADIGDRRMQRVHYGQQHCQQRHREHRNQGEHCADVASSYASSALVQRQRDGAPRIKQRQLIEEERPFVGRGSQVERQAGGQST